MKLIIQSQNTDPAEINGFGDIPIPNTKLVLNKLVKTRLETINDLMFVFLSFCYFLF